MTHTAKVLAFAGSTRRESFNKKLAQAATTIANTLAADATFVDLAEFPMPIYNGDLEAAEGIPEHATHLKELMKAHDAFIIASPEYNSSVTAVLKNTIDWVSRPGDGEPPLAAFTGKVAGLVAASPGALGGMRGLVHARAILGNIGVLVIPSQVALGSAHSAFADDGTLADEAMGKRLAAFTAELVETARKLGTA